MHKGEIKHGHLQNAEYGGVKYSCKVRVKGAAASAPVETTPPAQQEPTPTQPVSGVTLSLNRTDFTLHLSSTYKHNVYKGTPISAQVAADSITWTSENPAVCTVENGVALIIETLAKLFGWSYSATAKKLTRMREKLKIYLIQKGYEI